MNSIDLSDYKLTESDGVLILKNSNTTIAFVRFNLNGEIEYILIKKKKKKKSITKKIIKLKKKKKKKKLILQKPISPLGEKLIKSIRR